MEGIFPGLTSLDVRSSSPIAPIVRNYGDKCPCVFSMFPNVTRLNLSSMNTPVYPVQSQSLLYAVGKISPSSYQTDLQWTSRQRYSHLPSGIQIFQEPRGTMYGWIIVNPLRRATMAGQNILTGIRRNSQLFVAWIQPRQPETHEYQKCNLAR